MATPDTLVPDNNDLWGGRNTVLDRGQGDWRLCPWSNDTARILFWGSGRLHETYANTGDHHGHGDRGMG